MDDFRIDDGLVFRVREIRRLQGEDPYVADIIISDPDEGDMGTFSMRRSWMRELGLYCLKEDITAIRNIFHDLVLLPLRKPDPLTEAEKTMVGATLEGLARRFDNMAREETGG